MESLKSQKKFDYLFFLGISFLVVISIVVLSAIAPSLFPTYFVYLFLGVLAYFIFSNIDFDILSLFSRQFFFGSIILLILPLLIGQVTRGAIRWIPIGPLTIQPGEIVRPFLFLFFANYLNSSEVNLNNLVKACLLFALPFLLIVIQPSLGVAVITALGFLGILISSPVNKKHILISLLAMLLVIPLGWTVLKPYQQQRVLTFLEPARDPLGAGYNSIQSMISVGSGELFGRGLGKGIQTQLAFLPEKHTDFIFASIGEELGFIGAFLVLAVLFFILYKIILVIENAESPKARSFATGIFIAFFVQTIVHIGMNMGMLPITGLPLPLVSAGGSSFLATMVSLGMVISLKK